MGYSKNDMAVFYRTNGQSRIVEEMFIKANIPYKVVGSYYFYARKEIKDLICYLRLILNHDDELVMKLDAKNPFYTSMSPLDGENAVCFDGENIIYNNDSILTIDELPFKGNHFIQNILSAIGACISLGIDLEVIVDGVKSYKALNRRFAKLNDKPLIIDDFAHNPDKVNASMSALKSYKGRLILMFQPHGFSRKSCR